MSNVTVVRGQGLLFSATVQLQNGSLSNVATMTFTLLSPEWSVISVSPTNPSTGQYEATYTPEILGRWTYRWDGTNPDTALEGAFTVVGNASFS